MPLNVIISNSLEDYLEAILIISEKNDTVRITDLAENMGIAKSSATEAVKSLVDLGFLKHEKYGPVELTDRGKTSQGNKKTASLDKSF